MTTPITSNEHFLKRNVNMRNELIKQTDYLMLPDVYETLNDNQKQEIRDYRQSLRDFININRNEYLIKGINFIEFPKHPEWIKQIKIPKY